LVPAVSASADKYRLGPVSKQGSALLRWVLGQAAPLATRGDASLRRIYFAVLRRRGRPKAKVALAPAPTHPTLRHAARIGSITTSSAAEAEPDAMASS
jgi:transposase